MIKSLEKYLILLLAVLQSAALLGQSHGEGLKISHLTGDFYIFTTYNEFKGNLVSTNGMYMVSDSGVVLFDTPWDTLQFQPLIDSIRTKHNEEVVLCIATHSHEDRTAGLEYYRALGIQTYTTAQTDSISQISGDKRAEFRIHSDTVFRMGQYTFETFFPGHGHTEDNIVIWVNSEKILYGGCFVKSAEATDLGNITDADLASWLVAVKTVQSKYKHPAFIISGHQDWSSLKSLKHTKKLLQRHENPAPAK